MKLTCRAATLKDVSLLAQMNERLIHDESHRNPMSLGELRSRMQNWLKSGEFEGKIFEQDGLPVAYVLFHSSRTNVYIRHFFVERDFRRHGIGKSAIKLLIDLWDKKRIRVDVLVRNDPAIAFWHNCGFQDYALTLEREP